VTVTRPLELAKLHAIATKYSGTPEAAVKYLNLAQWLPRNLQRVMALGLDDGRPRRILDLGCGAGYFAYMCTMLGHEVVATDIAAREPLYVEVTELLGVPTVPHEVQAFEKLPDVGVFDMVTAFMICFNGHRTPGHLWKSDAWKFFLDDVDSHLHPGGLVCLELNREIGASTTYTPELEAFFKNRGATFTGHYPHAPTPGGHRLVIRRQ
jgi:SAM-dependent methyltransferase